MSLAESIDIPPPTAPVVDEVKVESPLSPSASATEPVRAESKAAPEAGETGDTAPKQETQDEPQPRKSASGRIAQLYAEKKTAEAQARFAQNEMARLRQELSRLNQMRGDPNLTLDQQDELRVRHAVRSERVEQLASEAEIKAELAAQARADAFKARVETVRDRMPDFDQVVTETNPPLSELAAELLAESEVGPQVVYHLGKNRAEALRIHALPAHLQGAEIARIEARLAADIRRTTNAPPPPPRVGGRSSPGAKDPASMSPAEYSEWYRQRSKGQ